MSDCPHGDGAHWIGDAGDVVAALGTMPTTTSRCAPYPLLPPTAAAWLRTLGAIQ